VVVVAQDVTRRRPAPAPDFAQLAADAAALADRLANGPTRKIDGEAAVAAALLDAETVSMLRQMADGLARVGRITAAAVAFRRAAPLYRWPYQPWSEMAELCAAVDGVPGPYDPQAPAVCVLCGLGPSPSGKVDLRLLPNGGGVCQDARACQQRLLDRAAGGGTPRPDVRAEAGGSGRRRGARPRRTGSGEGR
jgi:hypothetical protein